MALDKGLADGVLAAGIGPGRIEIGEARGKEHVDHFLHLFDVDGAALKGRKAHVTKAELANIFTEITHDLLLGPALSSA